MLVPSNTVPSSSIKYAFMTPPFLFCYPGFSILAQIFHYSIIFIWFCKQLLSISGFFFEEQFFRFPFSEQKSGPEAQIRAPGQGFFL